MNRFLIVGGGAAGMMASICAAMQGMEVHVFEQNEKLGKKLFITGKGRCNFTNACATEELFESFLTNPRFLYSAVYGFTNYDVIDFFENLGVTYLGPIDGHNIRQMERAFREAARVEGPVLIHVVTKKGKGYGPAERYPDRFHGTGPYDIRTGVLKDPKTKPDYTDVFGEALKNWAFSHRKTVAVTAAMPSGTSFLASVSEPWK